MQASKKILSLIFSIFVLALSSALVLSANSRIVAMQAISEYDESSFAVDLAIPAVAANQVKDSLEDLKENAKFVGSKGSKYTASTSGSCGGNWVFLPSIGYKLNLGVTPVSQWAPWSTPSLVQETVNNSNVVVLGHNRCPNGNCFTPGSDFAKLMYTKEGENGELCLNGKYYSGKVVFSSPVSEYDTHIMDNWLGKDTVTMFTCYGNCYDLGCNITDQRWAVAFERN